MPNKVIQAAVAILVIFALLAGGAWWASGQMSALARRLEAKLDAVDKKATTTIGEERAKSAAKDAENAALKVRNAVLETEKTTILAERDKARKDAEKAQAQLKVAPPEELLAKTQTWLDTREIWLRANAANQIEGIFSLAAFRTNAMTLEHGRYIEFSLLPSTQAELARTAEQLRNSDQQNANKDIQIAGHIKIEGEKDGQIAARDQTIVAKTAENAAIKKTKLLKDILYFLIGLGAGFAIHK